MYDVNKLVYKLLNIGKLYYSFMKYLSNLNVCLLFNDRLKIGKVSGRYKLDHSSHSSSRTIMVGWTVVVLGYRGILAMRERLLTSLMFLCLVS